ncbi:MAG TPA: Rieske (2Fe-2S) protein [Chloroflexota bacterium]|nr:Rieske (2Fe-2S) protein [Chloroflexota bacterium]
MSNDHDPAAPDPQPPPSLEDVVQLDSFLDALQGERRPERRDLDDEELRERLIAAQLRMAADGVEHPTPAFLASLEQTIGQEVARQGRPRRRPLSRLSFLRAAATFAGGAGIGVAGVEGIAALRDESRPRDLVVAGNDRWYAVAQADEVAPGGAKSFTAGGVMGFLLNDSGRLRAVSAICTHMGCRLKPDQAAGELHCLCHGSRFNRRGDVLSGMAPSPLPEIAIRMEGGLVYALGTKETV